MEEKELQVQETEGAGTRSMQKQSKKERVKSVLKKRFSAKRVSLMAVFVALSFAVSLLDFPIFPATPFLKLDFGNTFILLIAFMEVKRDRIRAQLKFSRRKKSPPGYNSVPSRPLRYPDRPPFPHTKKHRSLTDAFFISR